MNDFYWFLARRGLVATACFVPGGYRNASGGLVSHLKYRTIVRYADIVSNFQLNQVALQHAVACNGRELSQVLSGPDCARACRSPLRNRTGQKKRPPAQGRVASRTWNPAYRQSFASWIFFFRSCPYGVSRTPILDASTSIFHMSEVLGHGARRRRFRSEVWNEVTTPFET